MRVKKNLQIREYAKQKNVFLWEIGAELGINSCSITRRLRQELPNDQKKQIVQIIDKIAAEGANEDAK